MWFTPSFPDVAIRRLGCFSRMSANERMPVFASTASTMALFGFMVGRAAYGVEIRTGMADHIRALLTNYVTGVQTPSARGSGTLAASGRRAS